MFLETVVTLTLLLVNCLSEEQCTAQDGTPVTCPQFDTHFVCYCYPACLTTIGIFFIQIEFYICRISKL